MDSIKRIKELTRRGLIIPFTIPYEGLLVKQTKASVERYALWLPLFALLMGIINFSPIGINQRIDSGVLYGVVLMVLLPFVITREYCKKRNSKFAIMLPAEVWEKFAAFILLCFVIIPLYCIISGGLGFYIGTVLSGALFKGSFVLTYDLTDVMKYLQPSVISVCFLAVSCSLFLSLMIKNEIIQAIVAILFLFFFSLGLASIFIHDEIEALRFFSGKVATYVVYPLISLIILTGSYIKLKKERA